MTSLLEIEQRYRIDDAVQMIPLLGEHGITLQGEQHLIDQWFVPHSVHTREQHDTWFDSMHGLAYRIRTITSNGPNTEKPVVILDSKQHTAANNHNTFQERVIMRGDKAAMLRFLETEGYYNWLTLDKKRRLFHSPRNDVAITMDTIAGVKDAVGVDTVLEFEYKGSLSRQDALTLIGEFALTLGLSSDRRFPKSLTVESMSVLARFQ